MSGRLCRRSEERAARARERAKQQGKTPADLLQALLDLGPDEEPAPEDRLPEELREK